jgi:hypothetical protein
VQNHRCQAASRKSRNTASAEPATEMQFLQIESPPGITTPSAFVALEARLIVKATLLKRFIVSAILHEQ